MEHYFSEIPGHDSYPVESIVGALRNKYDTWIFEHLEWQLNNLDRLQHPKASEVRNILEKYWHGSPNKQIFLWNIPTVRRELSVMSHDIREEIKSTRDKVASFLLLDNSSDKDIREAA